MGTFPVELVVKNLRSSAHWLYKCILHQFASNFFQESSKNGSLVLDEKQTPHIDFTMCPFRNPEKKISDFFFKSSAPLELRNFKWSDFSKDTDNFRLFFTNISAPVKTYIEMGTSSNRDGRGGLPFVMVENPVKLSDFRSNEYLKRYWIHRP